MTTTLPPPALRTNQPFASPVAIGATGGVWTAVPVLMPRCPFCLAPVAGLLASCDKPDCRTWELNEELAHERRLDA